ncbi:retrovirus-related pol polyprotein from transposon TNT 1-94 [Tanacetum coccineum]
MMMNEMIRKKLEVATMQVNVQFLQQLQPEWNANPLAFVDVTQQYSDTHYQAPKTHKPYAPLSKPTPSTRSHAPTRNRGKEISKPITPPSESASEEDDDSDQKQAQRDKDMQKNLTLNVDTYTRHGNDNQTRQFRNQRIVTVVGARETVGNRVVQQTRIQCFNCKEFRHFAKECRKPKLAKDYAYHKEKMMMCKQEEKGVPLSAEQGDWLNDTDDEPDEHELEAHYMYMENIQEVLTADSRLTFDVEPLEHVQSNDDYNVFATKRQHSEQPKTINDTYVVETVDSNILKQLKKANTSLTHELNECKSALEESNDIRDRCRSALHDQEIKLENYKKYQNCQLEKEEVEHPDPDNLGLNEYSSIIDDASRITNDSTLTNDLGSNMSHVSTSFMSHPQKSGNSRKQDSPAEEAETGSNVWDDGLEDVNPFGRGNPGFHDDHYDNVFFQEEPIVLVEEESCPVYDTDNEEEESMPVYDTDIEYVIENEEGFVGKGGFSGEDDNIEDVVVVANDLCSSMIQTILSVDFEEDINTKSHELMSFGKKYYYQDDQVSKSSPCKEREFNAGDTNLDAQDIVDEEEEYPFVNKYPSFQEEPIVLVEEESCPVYDTDNEEEESMPVYDTNIEYVIEEEEGFVGKRGFSGEEDNIEDVVVVANDLCSSMIQTILSVDFEEDINTKSHELM